MDQPDTLEAFIDRLQAEGVEAGQQEAEQLRAAAELESAAILEEARESARQLIAQAEARTSAMQAEAKDELALAVRDALLDLRARLERTLTSLLEAGLERELDEPELLTRLLVEIVGAYARADADHEERPLEVAVRPEMLQELTAAAPGMLGRALADGTGVDLKADLHSVGFEYRIHDGVVQITPESVAEELVGLVSPQLRDLLRSAAPQSVAADAS